MAEITRRRLGELLRKLLDIVLRSPDGMQARDALAALAKEINQENRRVTLVDLKGLVEMWIENYAKLDEPARRRLPLQPIWFLAPQA